MGPVDTDGVVHLLSLLKKARLGFRAYDPIETPRLSLHTARRNVAGSFGVIAHLLSPNRDGADVHNALCALIAGIAVAEQKPVAMVQEEAVTQPIDYRDLVQHYDSPIQIAGLIGETLTQVVERLQGSPTTAPIQTGLLSELDLGDIAAENEIRGLRQYFVQTGAFQQVKQRHAQLVVGRKGSGKTALFYGVRDALWRGREMLILDMKPEGHQFTRLREVVLQELSLGQQEYVLAAFWTYLLSAEVAHKILASPSERRAAGRDPASFEAYEKLREAYDSHGLNAGDDPSGGDLSQRLLRQIDRIADRFSSYELITARSDLTELVYGGDIRTLNDAVADYLMSQKTEVWLLIDNLDKSWATRGSTAEDILILRGLLDASHKLQRQLDSRDVQFQSVVFLRTDVYEALRAGTPDRGKDSVVRLDWNDPEIFREIIRRRIVASTALDGSFEEVWSQIAPPLIGIQDSFSYILERTLLRPRDLLQFIDYAIHVALDRSHDKLTQDDILQAEQGYSEDMLLSLIFEIEDTHPDVSEAIYSFQGAASTMTLKTVYARLEGGGVPADKLSPIVELLFWYGFLGIAQHDPPEEQYAYSVRHNINRLKHAAEIGQGLCVIQPTFRAALSVA